MITARHGGPQGAGIAPGTTVTAVAGKPTTVTISTGISWPTLATTPDRRLGPALRAGRWNAVRPGVRHRRQPVRVLPDRSRRPSRRYETSRIRLALSAVQLLIERVIRNLEPQACPADISAAQWQWMKRYRVWQANREVFLWPENWLYPELRDDQSPIFKQVMGSLLQGDITDDAAASAYLDYLTGLEEVAKLEPCGLYYQPGTADTDETSYVVARTAGAHRKHYFRQLPGGSWTPWTEVTIECEDLPVTPVVWNGRLLLFWLKVLKQVAAGVSPSRRPATRAQRQLQAERPGRGSRRLLATARRCHPGQRPGRLVLDRVLQREVAAHQDLGRQPSDHGGQLRPDRARLVRGLPEPGADRARPPA